ncbi:hypothetical protein ACFP7A_08970 [Sporolactobacillus kofuensis]|uniref:Uncharacterized protein n=1 Tax=Sporolactobacillus kofuensis TaxID=269672 RepID=A0ABW1WHP0_9BACL|nr:hypothetical protein [Sporolactobacillus kofuensis]MCO7176145.1 hypothetical protein [Sporolactobacillus kofuensis]
MKTKKAAQLLMSFFELEQTLISHHEDPRPRFLEWIKDQQAKYFNAYVSGMAHDMEWENKSFAKTLKEPKEFLSLKRVVKETKKPSTSAKADDSKFKIYQKSTSAIIAQ